MVFQFFLLEYMSNMCMIQKYHLRPLKIDSLFYLRKFLKTNERGQKKTQTGKKNTKKTKICCFFWKFMQKLRGSGGKTENQF